MTVEQKIVTHSAQETFNLGFQMAKDLKMKEGRGKINLPLIMCLYGDLGSGKTTFAQGFAKGMGLLTRLPSPTFIIVRRYNIPSTDALLYHIDLYRLHSNEDIIGLGVHEIFADSKAYVLIEWAERLEKLPEERTDVHFESLQDDLHVIKIKNG